jgi:hypothetical protein
MVGVLFLPFDSCDNAKKNNPSSFATWVRHLRPYCGRTEPDEEVDRLEKLYIALYEPTGSDLRFFDVEGAPPKAGRPRREGDLLSSNGRPQRLLSYAEFLDAVYDNYLQRNRTEFSWSDGSEQPLEVDESEEDEENDT